MAVKLNLIIILIHIFLMGDDGERGFMYSLSLCLLSWEKGLLRHFAHI